MLAAFLGLMMLTIDLDDQLQCNATEINRVRWDWVFTTKLLISTTAIAQHLPNILSKFVCAGSLIASKRNRLWIAPRSSVHAAPPIHDRHCSTPHPQPFSPIHEGEHHSPSWMGEKGASLEQVGSGEQTKFPHLIGHRTQFELRLRRGSWTILAEEAIPPRRFGRRHLGELPGSTQTSPKMGPKIGETAAKRLGELREVDAADVTNDP